MILPVTKPVADLSERTTALLIQVYHGRGGNIWLIMTAEVRYFLLSYKVNVPFYFKVVYLRAWSRAEVCQHFGFKDVCWGGRQKGFTRKVKSRNSRAGKT